MDALNSNNDLRKTELLRELESLGYNAKTGRKLRSDAGTKRGPNSKQRSDAGIQRVNTSAQLRDPLSLYFIVKNKLLNLENDDLKVEQDVNGYFLLRNKWSKVVNENYIVVSRGVARHRTVKHMQGKEVDLERYRFEGLLSHCINEPIDEKYKSKLKQELEYTNAKTWLELFCRWYHIREEEYIYFTYDKWRRDYSIVASMEPLSKDFWFHPRFSPGTSEFLPEYESSALEVLEKKRASLLSSKKYQNVYAHYRDELFGKAFIEKKRQILSTTESIELTVEQIDRRARKLIDKDAIIRQTEEYMQNWLNEQLKGEE